jgi:glucosamine--fructose-6-phosphate aminotransferase (isomerizing)
LDKDTEKIVACRDGSPMVLGVGQNQLFLASDVAALLKHTDQVVFLEDGQGVVIKSKDFSVYDLESRSKLDAEIETIDWDEAQADKQDYPHYLIKEIFEQKEIIPQLVDLNQAALAELKPKLGQFEEIYLIGCGTAYHVSLLAKYYFAQQGLTTHAVQAHEFESFASYLGPSSMVIAVSQSGETADTIIASKLAQARGAHLVSLINAKGSTLSRLADTNLEVGAGPEIAVVSTKASTAQLINLYLLANSAGNMRQSQRKVEQFSQKLKTWLAPKLKEQLLNLAKGLMDEQHSYVIGKKVNYPAALEFALKIKETSYQHAEGFASSELKHGVISLISTDTPCFVLSDKATHMDVSSSAIEVKSRGGRIIGIGPNNSESYHQWIKIPEAGELTSIYAIIVGQLLGYMIGVGRGVDPDKPRNLAKSVTVK